MSTQDQGKPNQSRPELKARTLDARILLSGTLLDCDQDDHEIEITELCDNENLIPDNDDCDRVDLLDKVRGLFGGALDHLSDGLDFGDDNRICDQQISDVGVSQLDHDGNLRYSPNCGSKGIDKLAFLRPRQDGGCDKIDVCVQSNIDAVDDGVFVTDEDTDVSGNVLANDINADGAEIALIAGPANGTVTLADDGSFVYTPKDGFTGEDTFQYKICKDIDPQCLDVELTYDTAYEGQGGKHWGDPHFLGDDGGRYDIQGEDSAMYNMLSDKNLQYNAKFEYWNGTTGTVVGELGVLLGTDEIYFNKDAVACLNGVELEAGDCIQLDCGTVQFDGNNLTVESSEYKLEFIAQENPWGRFVDGNYTAKNPFGDGVAAHGLWGQTVDADTEMREGDLGIDVQGGGAIDTLDEDGNIVRTVSGDLDSVNLYRTEGLFSTCGLNDNTFFRYDAEVGTGLTLQDGVSLKDCDVATVTVNVEDTNEGPEGVKDRYTVEEDGELEGNVLDNDTDPDGDVLTASPFTDMQTLKGGRVTLHEDGSFIYTPREGYSGRDTFCYVVQDNNGGEDLVNVCINVEETDEVPTAENDSYKGDDLSDIKGNVILNDIDGDGDGIRVTLVDGPTDGVLKLNADGTFNYDANDGFGGTDSFTYTITDANGDTDSATVRLVVCEVEFDTDYEGEGGKIWGDPHFVGDDGGKYDIHGEAGHIYNILSDRELQVNTSYKPWHIAGTTVMSEIGITSGADQIYVTDYESPLVNGKAVRNGQTVHLADGGSVAFDGRNTTVITPEYSLTILSQTSQGVDHLDMRLEALDPFSDSIAPHGLWGLTVDADSNERRGDDLWSVRKQGLGADKAQGGGAIDTIDADGNIVLSQSGDVEAYKLYETSDLFSKVALDEKGSQFFRFAAERGTGLNRK